MRKLILIILICLITPLKVICTETAVSENVIKNPDAVIYSQDNKFGLKAKDGEALTEPIYQKLIRVGENGVWLIQKKNKFGLITADGDIIVKPKYRQAERVFIKYVKLGNERDWGLYDENGVNIIPHEYSSIDPLFGKKFLTCKNYKYGIINFEGKKLLNNDFEDIYMPDSNTLRIKHNGEWYEIVKLADDNIEVPEYAKEFKVDNNRYSIAKLVNSTGVTSGYSVVTATDYVLKILTSISPAYEETIDELMLSKGAETVSAFIKFSWIPKFPFTYIKNYYQNIRNPNNGPLSNIKNRLKKKI